MVHLARIMLELWISMRSRAGYPEVRRMLNPLRGRDGELTSLGGSHAPREQRYWPLQDIQMLLEQAALRQPMLICLDDLQWADSGTSRVRYGPALGPCAPAPNCGTSPGPAE
jgi:hypothetical protein